MKLQTLHEAKYTSTSKSLQTLLQFFEEEEGLDEGDKVFYVNEKFLARRPNVQGGSEVIRLEFLEETPDDVIIMYSDGETDGISIQQAIAELVIFRVEKVY